MITIKSYKQHSLETCGAACALIALHAFGKGYATVRREQNLYAAFRARARVGDYRAAGMYGSAIATILARCGLDVRLVHASHDMLENLDINHPAAPDRPLLGQPYYLPEIHRAMLNEHKSWIDREDRCFDVTVGVDITYSSFRDELAAGRLLIVQTIIPGDCDGIHDRVLHWIVVYGYEAGLFHAFDPLPNGGRFTLPDNELAALIDTPIGASYIAVGEKPAVR